MKKNYKLVIAGILVLLLAFVAYRIVSGRDSADTRKQNIPLVRVEQPKRMTVAYKLEFNGDMVPIKQATIFSKVSGNLEQVYVDMGAKVRAGQLLALIDTTELRQQYQQARATYENARITFVRTKDLSEQNLVAKQDIDNADAAMKVASANYELAATRLGYARIPAPFDGYITKRFLDPGALVNPGTSGNTNLFTIMDLDQMKVVVNVLEKDIPKITIGKKAVITVDAFPGKQFFGSITRYSEAVDLPTRTMAVEIDVDNKDHTLKPGMYATVNILVDEHMDALTLPTMSILKDDNGAFVFMAANDSAKKLPVKLGVEQDTRTEILTGLDGTEHIITTGQQFVRAGGPVSIQHN